MKNKYKTIIVISFIIVFAAGIVSGIFCDKYFINKGLTKPPRDRKPRPHFPTLEIMSKELDLDSSQEQAIREIFKRTEEKLDEVRRQVGKQFFSIRKDLLTDIKNILNEEQKIKFEEMIEQHLQERKKAAQRTKDKPKKEKQKETGGSYEKENNH